MSADDQRRDGMYMIGQVAALRKNVCHIADLHAEVSTGSTALLRTLAPPPRPHAIRSAPSATPARVAIVGMGCLLPQAPDIRTLWSNILNRRDAITEIPADRFDANRYFSTDRRARDRFYSKWGGFLEEVAFDPIKYGIPPGAVPSIDPFQLLTLEVVYQALGDAGYSDRPFNRERTSVILGASGGVGDLGFHYGIRAGLPMYFDHVSEETLARLPEWTEDSFAGVLLNVAAGRVANRLDLGGLNFTVDAACASSLAAIFLAARELETGSSDMAIVGGIDTVNSPSGYLCFSSAQALSPRGRCSTFDDSADGIAISEGLVALVLKRLPDAERDGDRIYA
ncbi:MAG: polyketide synthase, partial [bacterium]